MHSHWYDGMDNKPENCRESDKCPITIKEDMDRKMPNPGLRDLQAEADKAFQAHVMWAKSRKPDTQDESGLSDVEWDMVQNPDYGVKYDMSESDAIGSWGNQPTTWGKDVPIVREVPKVHVDSYFAGPDGFVWYAPDGVNQPESSYNARQVDHWDNGNEIPKNHMRYMWEVCAQLSAMHAEQMCKTDMAVFRVKVRNYLKEHFAHELTIAEVLDILNK